jgi:hypothetical protein
MLRGALIARVTRLKMLERNPRTLASTICLGYAHRLVPLELFTFLDLLLTPQPRVPPGILVLQSTELFLPTHRVWLSKCLCFGLLIPLLYHFCAGSASGVNVAFANLAFPYCGAVP